jgi:hypothetical protein
VELNGTAAATTLEVFDSVLDLGLPFVLVEATACADVDALPLPKSNEAADGSNPLVKSAAAAGGTAEVVGVFVGGLNLPLF